MTVSPLYLIRRCDRFYRYWHDVTAPAPLQKAYQAYIRLTDGGVRNTTPEDPEYYDIFRADPLPGQPYQFFVRRLTRQDAPAIQAHLAALDRSDRRFRFFLNLSDLQINTYVERMNWSRSIVLGAVLADNVVGMAEIVFDRDTRPQHAEIAVSVDLRHRRQGLGRYLVAQLVDRAELHGVFRPHFLVLRDNLPALEIVKALGGEIQRETYPGAEEVLAILGRSPVPDSREAAI